MINDSKSIYYHHHKGEFKILGEGPVEYLRVQTLGEIPNSAPEIVSCSGKTFNLLLYTMRVSQLDSAYLEYNCA